MWRAKKLSLSLSPSPQTGKPAMRTPLRELILQPGALTKSEKSLTACSSLTPSLCKLGLQKTGSLAQEGSNNSSPVDSINAKRTDSPSEHFNHSSKWLEACQHESDEQPLDLVPQTSSTPKMLEEAVDPLDNYIVKTIVLVPSPLGQQQDMTFEAHLATMAETNSISLNEPLRPGDLVRKEAASCLEDRFSAVVAAVSEKAVFQDSPSHLLEYPSNACSEQLYCSKESLRDSRTEAVPEDLVPSESNTFLPSSALWLSPSTALAADIPVNHVDPEEEILEHGALEEREMSFPTHPEEFELGDQALVSNVEDIPSTCLTPNLVDMESQAAPGPAVDVGRILGSDTEPWMSPLAWLEKGVNTSVMLENLRQSLSLPLMLRDAAVGTTPFSTCLVGTLFTPSAPHEKSTNTSQTGLVGTKDSSSETEQFLCGRPPDLTALSRRDLEDNLLSSLVILEVLSLQLRDWKSQLAVPHPETQDSSTQTDTSPSGQSWVLISKELISLLHLSLLHLEEDKTTVSQESRRTETLVSCCFELLKKLRAKLQSLKAEREEARHREEMALRGKDAAETVLEAFCAHASQRISQLEQDLASMREFRGLLKDTQTQLVRLHTEQEELVQQTVSLTSTLQQDWMSIQLDYTTWTALLSQSRQLTEKLTVKSRQALQDRDAAIEEKHEVSRELEQVSAQLEECKGQIEQLELENSHLATDLRAQLQILANMDSQLKELQSQHAHCAQDLSVKDELLRQLSQSNEEQAAQ
ncbi:Sperm-associated antigen 5 [Saguinus oedipus]|uniref:Sperm-associated antigen 5 n=1 Tax=Saguinus oedipus TaxID=9490 RepID=A0ABQ9VQ51_SAGOE|nr:Sperm-associated antigen 5 [Saguinus oedipus]